MTTTPLNPYATHDPAANLSQNVFYKRLYTVALVATTVGIAALAIFAIAYTSTFWPAHLTLVTLIVLAGGLPTSSWALKGLWNKMNYYKKEAAFDEKLKRGVEEISTDNLSSKINELGFSSSASDSVQKNLLSRYHLLEETVKKFKSEAEIGDEIELYMDGKVRTIRPAEYRISEVDFENPEEAKIFDTLQRRQYKREKLLYSAAVVHLKAAYLLHLIQKPEDKRDFEEFVKLPSSPIQHIIAQIAGDPTAYTIAKAAGKVFKRDQILNTSAAKLSSQIFGLKRNWY